MNEPLLRDLEAAIQDRDTWNDTRNSNAKVWLQVGPGSNEVLVYNEDGAHVLPGLSSEEAYHLAQELIRASEIALRIKRLS